MEQNHFSFDTSVRSSQKLTEGSRPSKVAKDVPKKSASKENIELRASKMSVVKTDNIFTDPLYNSNGTRNESIPFDLFIVRKKHEEREKNKKQVKVSTITKNDVVVLKEGLKKLKQERARENSRRMMFLKSLKKSRVTVRPAKKKDATGVGDQKYPCPLKCGSSCSSRSKSRSKSRNRSKSKDDKKAVFNRRPVIELPPLKTKPWKSPLELAKEKGAQAKSRFPKIVIPPFKTRKWVPAPLAKPKQKVVIEYPPLKLRKRPWKPREKKIKRKVFNVTKLFNPNPSSTLGKTWHSFKLISPKQQILNGNFSQYSKKFGFRTNGKQSAFISAVALSSADLYPMRLWKSSILDEIVSYGDINLRRHLHNFKHKNVFKPSDVYHKVYLKYAKILVEIGEVTSKGIYDPENSMDIKLHIEDVLAKFTALICLYNGQSYGIWKEDNGYFIFNAEDTDEKGRLVERARGSCCVIRSTNLMTIVEYLVNAFRVAKQLYEIFSFRVNQKILIQDLEAREKGEKAKIIETVEAPDEHNETEKDQQPQQEISPKTGLAAVLFRHQMEPTFGDNFQFSTLPNHAFIACANYLNREMKYRAPYISSIATVMLQICKSSLWMSATLERIFQIGHEFYVKNVEEVLMKKEQREFEWLEAMMPGEEEEEEVLDDEEDFEEEEEPKPLTKEEIRELRRQRLLKPPVEIKVKPDIPITEINPVVTVGNMKHTIIVETLNIGKIQSRDPEELNLEAGIKILFKYYDYGLIIGPDVVSIWRENNRYFMFDPNQCKLYKRYHEDDEHPFNSCLSCFHNLSDLVTLYIENLHKTQRNAVYKICKIEIRDFIEKSTDWQYFKAIDQNKWILSGTISESSDEFEEANRNHQSTCMSVVAIAKSREIGLFSFTTDVIDDIVRIGNEFYAGCVLKLKEMEKFENPDLTLNELEKELMLDKVIVDLSYEESVVYGKLHVHDGSFIKLSDGLEMFFKNDDLGVITACGISVAVLKFSDGYFLFDSHSRDDFGRNFKTVDPIGSCTIKGAACMMRFETIDQLANHLLANFESSDSAFYTISKVDVSVRSSAAPCLYNYKAFGDDEFGAMLKSFNENHEDCEQFRYTKIEKTFCNLISGMCYASMFNPRYWASNDINEILKIGWKLLCRASDDVWESLKNIEVCSTKFCVEVSETFEGIFIAKQRLLSGMSTSNEVLEEHTEISEINKSIDDVHEKSNESMADEMTKREDSSVFPVISNGENSEVLKDILETIDSNEKFFAILISPLFTVGIFKIDKFYYVFDPKASMNGMLIKKRLEDFMKNNLEKEYEKLIERLQELNNDRRLSMEEQMEELIFGRQVVFGIPTIKPSQTEITFNRSFGAVDNEDPINISEKGSAYIAWFTTLELMYQHIIDKVPERFTDHQFEIKVIKASKDTSDLTLETSKWVNFDKIGDEHWIIRGTFSQNDSQFPVTHRNNQDVANCILALAFKNICSDEDWNTTAIDVVLKFGDRLFRKSLAKKLKTTSLRADQLRLKFSEMELPIFIRPYIITCTEHVACTDYIIKANDAVPLENFKISMQSFLDGGHAGFLTCKNYYVAIWKCNDGAIIMFDPHDIGPDGIIKSKGLSSLQRFTNHSDLVEVFWKNVKDLDGVNEFMLINIKMELTHFKDGEEDVFECDDCDFSAPASRERVKIIHGATTKANTQKVEMTICYAVAAHCLCQALDSEYYTSDIIDRIVMFGNELVCECCTNDEVCFRDFNLSAHTSCPDEITWNFQLNDTFTTIQLDIFRRGTVSKEPCPLPNLIFVLEEFFDFHCSGVLTTSEFIAPIWKDKDEYFIFFSFPIDVNGLKKNDGMGSPGLIILKSVHELYTYVLKNIRQQLVPFELRMCNIKMSDEVENADEKCCTNKMWMKKVVKEEVVMPAVSFREIEKVKASKSQLSAGDSELKVMISNLKKKRRGNDKGFIKFSRGGFICGRMSKESKCLNELSRKFHCPAICLYSVAMHTIISMNCWNCDVIDCVILSGNSLYVESSIIAGSPEVDITSIVTPMFIDNHEVIAKAESCLEIANEDFISEHLQPVFCELLSCFNACYVRKSLDYWTIIKTDEFYFLFDPLGIEVPGKKMPIFYATLYRFDSLKLLFEQLEDCIERTKDGSSLEIGGICVSSRTVKSKPAKAKTSKKKLPRCPSYKASKPVMNIQLRHHSKEDIPCVNKTHLC